MRFNKFSMDGGEWVYFTGEYDSHAAALRYIYNNYNTGFITIRLYLDVEPPVELIKKTLKDLVEMRRNVEDEIKQTWNILVEIENGK